jgi:hypothetical protein
MQAIMQKRWKMKNPEPVFPSYPTQRGQTATGALGACGKLRCQSALNAFLVVFAGNLLACAACTTRLYLLFLIFANIVAQRVKWIAP